MNINTLSGPIRIADLEEPPIGVTVYALAADEDGNLYQVLHTNWTYEEGDR
jgi:hypothetical protein